MNNKIKAFSLAEVLLTLVIIGVISALSIPALKKQATQKETVALVTNAYSTLSNATQILKTENGPIRFWGWGDTENSKGGDTIMSNFYTKKMSISKNCEMNQGCFPARYSVRKLSGSKDNSFDPNDGSWYTFITMDGVFWAIKAGSSGKSGVCNLAVGKDMKNACGLFYVDINGGEKPNMYGVDIFAFGVTSDGVYPFGGCPTCYNGCGGSIKLASGLSCTAKLVSTGKITW